LPNEFCQLQALLLTTTSRPTLLKNHTSPRTKPF